MSKLRKSYSAEEKAKIVLDALKGELTQSQISSKYDVHSTQIASWKRQLKDGIIGIFKDQRRKHTDPDQTELIEELYKKIGQLEFQLDWVKKNLTYSNNQKRRCIDTRNTQINIAQQCVLLGLPRSTYYYAPQEEDELTLTLMNLIDEEYTRHPFYGTRKMTAYLQNNGFCVNRKRVQTLYRKMRIEAIYPKPNLTKRNKEHEIYPYLLRGKTIEHCNHVWSTDITYIRMKYGFVYLMAIIDWYSRYVLDWEFSTSLNADFCGAPMA